MRRVAVFGNAGGGKSTLARRLAAATQLPLHVIDEMQFRAGGMAVPQEEYLQDHAKMLSRAEWIIDGFGGVRAAWERFSAADTLVLVDLPLITHYWWVTKRLVRGLFATPPGWPPDSPVWSSSIEQLPGHLELPHVSHSEISRPDRRKRFLEARSPLALARRDRSVHRPSRARTLSRDRSRVTREPDEAP